jgi:DNA-binding SARP family transcriptional activator
MSQPSVDLVVHLFGGPFVTVGTQRWEAPAGSRHLLAFVALQQRPVERRHAAAVLWPAMSASRAGGNLRSALWRLRGAGIEAVTADQSCLALAPRVTVDAREVGEWAARLISGRALPGDLAVLPSSTEALDLLPGCYDDWALIERERLRQQILRALEALSRRLAAADRFGDAVDAAMIAVHAEPLRESAQRALVEAHLAEGNVIEALRAYRAYASLLRREVGVAPAAELTALVATPDRHRPRREALPAARPRTRRTGHWDLPGLAHARSGATIV